MAEIMKIKICPQCGTRYSKKEGQFKTVCSLKHCPYCGSISNKRYIIYSRTKIDLFYNLFISFVSPSSISLKDLGLFSFPFSRHLSISSLKPSGQSGLNFLGLVVLLLCVPSRNICSFHWDAFPLALQRVFSHRPSQVDVVQALSSFLPHE